MKTDDKRVKVTGIQQIYGDQERVIYFIGARHSTWYGNHYSEDPPADMLSFRFYMTEKKLKQGVNASLRNPHILTVVDGRFTLRQLLEQLGHDSKLYPGERTHEPEVMKQVQSYLHGESGLTKAQLLKKIGGLLP